MDAEPIAGTWRDISALAAGRYDHALVSSQQGIFVIGGCGEGGAGLATVERLVPEWYGVRAERAGTLNFPRRAPRAVALPRGRILVAFGDGDQGTGQASAEIFDPATGISTAIPSAGRTRIGAALVTLAEGRGILAVGGWVAGSGAELTLAPVADVSSFHVEKVRWTEERPIRTPQSEAGVVALSTGGVLVTGGHRGFEATDHVERRDRTGMWHVQTPMNRARARHTATALADGRVLVAGGFGAGTLGEDSAEVFDPSDGRWTMTSSMVRGESGHTATLLRDGRVLVVGAHGWSQVFDPVRMRWMAAGTLPDARHGHATLAWPFPEGAEGAEGLILVGGNASGSSPAQPLASCAAWTANGIARVAEGPERLPSCPACDAQLEGERIAMHRWDDESEKWRVTLSCGRCLSAVCFPWPAPDPAEVVVEVTGAFVSRLRDRLVAAAAEGPVTGYREAMKAFREPSGWLLSVPEVFAAIRTVLVPMKLTSPSGPARATGAAPFPSGPTALLAFREGHPRGTRFRVTGVRNHEFVVVPERTPDAAPFLCSLDLLVPADRAL